MNLGAKKGIAALALLGALGAPVLPDNVPDHLKLKVDKEKIYKTETLSADTIRYSYISNDTVSAMPSEEVQKKARKDGLTIVREVDAKRSHSSRVFETDRPNVYVAEFVPGEQYSKVSGIWKHVEYGTTTPDAFEKQMSPNKSVLGKLFGAFRASAQTTFYPAKDGAIGNFNGFATARAATAGTNGPYISDDRCLQVVSSGIARCTILFLTGDTIGASDTINSAVVSLYITYNGVGDNDGKDQIVLTQSSVSTSGAVALEDFDIMSDTLNTPTEGATRLDISSGTTVNAYNDITLNATGRGWVGKGAGTYTKLGFREGHDVDNDAPGAENQLNIRYSDYTGTANDPKLVVTFSAGAGAATPDDGLIIFE